MKIETEGTRWRFWRLLRHALSISVTQSFHFFHWTLTERFFHWTREPGLNPLEAKKRCGAFSFCTSGDIFTQPINPECCTKCEVVSRRRRKGTWTAEEVVEWGGLVFQILFVYLCCVVCVPGHWWKKEPLKNIRTWEGKKR